MLQDPLFGISGRLGFGFRVESSCVSDFVVFLQAFVVRGVVLMFQCKPYTRKSEPQTRNPKPVRLEASAGSVREIRQTL